MNDFYKRLLTKLFDSYKNKYYNNFDFEIRKGTNLEKLITKRTATEKEISQNLDFMLFPSIHGSYFMDNIDKFEYLMEYLTDNRSKKIYIELLAYKILGFTKVKLSLNNKEFWKKREQTKEFETAKTLSYPSFQKGYLSLYNIKDLGFDLSLYFTSNGVVVAFMLEQYAYEDIVSVEENDIVIDCGGCWGDTALYFSAKGAKAVYVFEFIESNLEIMKKNIELNKHYDEKINIIKNPVWNRSNVKLSYKDSGPSSVVNEFSIYENKVETLSIDDLVKIKNLSIVNFIKMDIEGAEIPALEGAVNTIKKFKPKLAISAYHKSDDLIKIPKLILSIRDDYEFYLDYYTIIADEIVLYAI